MRSLSKRKSEDEPRSPPPPPPRPIESFRYIPLRCIGNRGSGSEEDNASIRERNLAEELKAGKGKAVLEGNDPVLAEAKNSPPFSEGLKAEKGKAVIPPRPIESYRHVPHNKADTSTCPFPAHIASTSVLKPAARVARATSFTAGPRRGPPLTGRKSRKEKVQREKAPTLSAEQKRREAYMRLRYPTKWTPPRSPHNLLQESYYKNPWKVLIICMLCNKTTGKQAERVLRQLFRACPSPMAAVHTPSQVIKEIIRPLGLQNERALKIKFFSLQYLEDSWEYVTELYGVGKYAADAYAIFCKGSWQNISPDDHKLVDYWLFLNEHFGLIDDARAVKYQVDTSEDPVYEI